MYLMCSDLILAEEEMQAEKEKLYQALDYSEGAKVASYPKEVSK